VSRAVARGVEVVVYTDRANLEEGRPRSARAAFAELSASAATVKIVDRLHSKTLCIDDEAMDRRPSLPTISSSSPLNPRTRVVVT